MIYSIPLEQLPDDLLFPEHLRGRIVHLSNYQRLNFHGFMTKSDYDELINLHEDSNYRQAIERLFVLSSAELRPQASKRFQILTWILVLIGVFVLVAVMVAWTAL